MVLLSLSLVGVTPKINRFWLSASILDLGQGIINYNPSLVCKTLHVSGHTDHYESVEFACQADIIILYWLVKHYVPGQTPHVSFHTLGQTNFFVKQEL